MEATRVRQVNSPNAEVVRKDAPVLPTIYARSLSLAARITFALAPAVRDKVAGPVYRQLMEFWDPFGNGAGGRRPET